MNRGDLCAIGHRFSLIAIYPVNDQTHRFWRTRASLYRQRLLGVDEEKSELEPSSRLIAERRGITSMGELS